MKGFILSLFLLINTFVFAQKPSVFLQTYSLSKRQSSSGSYDVLKKQRTHIKQGFGMYWPYKQVFLYSEFVFSAYKNREEQLFPSFSFLRTNETSIHTNYNLKLGIGKTYQLSKKLTCLFTPFIEVGYQPRINNTVSYFSVVTPSNQVLSKKEVYTLPFEMEYALGFKLLIDYKVGKRLFIGVALDNSYRYTSSKGYRWLETIQYDYIGELLSKNHSKVFFNTSEFRFKWLQSGVYLRYRIPYKTYY